MTNRQTHPLRIGISACLLGQRVRYDGGHKRHAWLVEELGTEVAWLAVCPEVELGLGVPRETIDLVRGESGEVRLIASRSRRDLTTAMTGFAAARVAELAGAGLSGYVLKSKSPSCGLERVRVLGDDGSDASEGRGLFAAALRAGMPGLPIVEDGDLDTAEGRAAFVAGVRRYRGSRDGQE